MDAIVKEPATDRAAQDAADGNARRPLNAEEAHYMMGDMKPATPSVLISNSKYLNDPYYRDTFVQHCLRRNGPDVAFTYMVPAIAKAIAQVSDPADAQRLVDAEKEKNPEFKAFLTDRIYHDFTPENTRGYAPGTLGATIHDFLVSSGMKLDFMYSGDSKGDLAYIAKRLLGVHDIGHMVTGLGPNSVGEPSLAICVMTIHANYFSPELASYLAQNNLWVVVGQIMHVNLHYPAVAPTLYDGIRQGIAAGQNVRLPFFMTDWTQHLDKSLEDLSAELGIVRGPGAAWDWTNEAARG